MVLLSWPLLAAYEVLVWTAALRGMEIAAGGKSAPVLDLGVVLGGLVSCIGLGGGVVVEGCEGDWKRTHPPHVSAFGCVPPRISHHGLYGRAHARTVLVADAIRDVGVARTGDST